MGYFFTLLARFGIVLSMGTGMHLVFSLGGIFFLGMPTVVSLTAYALAIAEKAGYAPLWAAAIALLVNLCAGLLFAILYLRVSADSFAVLGLASILAFEALTRSWSELTNGVLGLAGIVRPELHAAEWSFGLFNLTLGILIVAGEYVLLQTFWGRALRALKENPVSLEALGISSDRLARNTIILSSLLFGIGSIVMVWQIQFLEPSFAGLMLLIEMLTVGILALKPEVKRVVGGAIFVIALPEFLRFLDLPVTLFGHLRVLLYSILLIVLIRFLNTKISITSRCL